MKPKNLPVIDWEPVADERADENADDGVGGAVRLYLGKPTTQWAAWTGDDWDDAPYEYNAGLVYPEYVVARALVTLKHGVRYWEPCSYALTPMGWTKNDMKSQRVPMLRFDGSDIRFMFGKGTGIICTRKKLWFYMGEALERFCEMGVVEQMDVT